MAQSSGLTLEQALALGGKPSEDGLTYEQAVALGGKPNSSSMPTSPSDVAKSFAKTGVDLLAGIGSGVLNTSLGVSKLMNRATGGRLGVSPSTTLEDIGMQPTNTAQKIGMGAEQVGEFFLPAGAIGEGTKAVEAATAASKLPQLVKTGLNLAARSGLEAAGAGAVTAAQTGGNPDATKTAAAIAAAFPVAGKILEPAADAIKNVLSQKLPGRIVESLIKPPKKEMMFGRTPGQEVAAQGLKANTLDGLEKEIAQRKNQVGTVIDGMLQSPSASAQKIDIVPEINNVIDEAVKNAKIDGNSALASRLEDFRKGQLMERFGLSSMPPQWEVSPLEARKIKTAIGDSVRWSEDPLQSSMNEVKQTIYRNLNDAIDNAVPGVKEANRSYANLLSAQKSVNARIDAVNKLNFIGLTESAASVATTLAGAVLTGDISSAGAMGLLGLGASKGLRASSTATGTRLAAGLAQLSPQQKTLLASRLLPFLRNVGLGVNSMTADQDSIGQK